MNARRPSSAHWRSSKTRTVVPRSAIRSKKRRQAAKSSSVGRRRSSSPSSARRRGRIQRGSSASATNSSRTPRACRRWTRRRPARRCPPDVGPSRRAPRRRYPRHTPASGPGASRRVSTRPSRYFCNSQARRLLPIPATPVIEIRRARRSAPVAWSRSLIAANSASRPTNGGSMRSLRPAPPTRATTRHARHAATGRPCPSTPARRPVRTRSRPAPPYGRLPDEDGARRCGRLQARGGVHEVAGDHALARSADRDRSLAGVDGARASWSRPIVRAPAPWRPGQWPPGPHARHRPRGPSARPRRP